MISLRMRRILKKRRGRGEGVSYKTFQTKTVIKISSRNNILSRINYLKLLYGKAVLNEKNMYIEQYSFYSDYDKCNFKFKIDPSHRSSNI